MKTTCLFLILCVTAAWIPFFRPTRELKDAGDGNFPGWFKAPVPEGLSALPAGERERRFSADFPCRIGTFSDEGKIYVVRWLRQPTRKLHPASDCLRALGYSVKPAPVFSDAAGHLWGSTLARRDNERLIVRERIIDEHGRTWTDTSAWFWTAIAGQSQGPWWAVTTFETARDR